MQILFLRISNYGQLNQLSELPNQFRCTPEAWKTKVRFEQPHA